MALAVCVTVPERLLRKMTVIVSELILDRCVELKMGNLTSQELHTPFLTPDIVLQ